MDGLDGPNQLNTASSIDQELVREIVDEIRSIRGNSGVGSPEVAKHVDSWQATPVQPNNDKTALIRPLAEQLYQRRPVLYLKGHKEPFPATVLLRAVRKSSVSALTKTGTAAGLFQSPDNTFIVIKFPPQFNYADIIVDPFFSDAFLQQPATPTYNELLQQLPRAFVGTAPELRKLVALLTAQSARAYAARGVSCPPWRRFDSMLARWLPKQYADKPITHGPSAAPVATPTATAVVPVPAQTPAASSADISEHSPLLKSAAVSDLNVAGKPSVLVRSDSSISISISSDSSRGSSTSSGFAPHGGSFSMGSVAGSNASVGSPVLAPTVYGFDIPSKVVSKNAQLPAAALAPAPAEVPEAAVAEAAVGAAAILPVASSKQEAAVSKTAAVSTAVSVATQSTSAEMNNDAAPAAAAAAAANSRVAVAFDGLVATNNEASNAPADVLSMDFVTANNDVDLSIARHKAAEQVRVAAGTDSKQPFCAQGAALVKPGQLYNHPVVTSGDLLASYGYSSIHVVKLTGQTLAAAAVGIPVRSAKQFAAAKANLVKPSAILNKPFSSLGLAATPASAIKDVLQDVSEELLRPVDNKSASGDGGSEGVGTAKLTGSDYGVSVCGEAAHRGTVSDSSGVPSDNTPGFGGTGSNAQVMVGGHGDSKALGTGKGYGVDPKQQSGWDLPSMVSRLRQAVGATAAGPGFVDAGSSYADAVAVGMPVESSVVHAKKYACSYGARAA